MSTVRRVFISHSHVDFEVAERICVQLEQAGVPCWISTRDILPGAPYGEAIVHGIEETSVLLLVFSRHSNDSPQVAREIERAVSANKIIIPFRIEDLPPGRNLEYFLGLPNWLNAFPKPWESYLDALTRAVQQSLGPSAAVPPSPQSAVKKSPEPKPSFKYWAFISTSHADYGRPHQWPERLRKSLEAFRVPAKLVGRETGRDYVVPDSVSPVFWNHEESLDSFDVEDSLNFAMRESRFLVVICSMRGSMSAGLNEEIRRFKLLGRENRIIPFVIDGGPSRPEWPDDCFPPALRQKIGPNGEILPEKAEKIAYIDAHDLGRQEKSLLKLLAAILGVGYRELCRAEEERRRGKIIRKYLFVAAVFAGVCLMVFLLWFYRR